jgi:hypothetical protein
MDAVDEDGDQVISKDEFLIGAQKVEKFAEVVAQIKSNEFEAAILATIWDKFFDEDRTIGPPELHHLILVYGKVCSTPPHPYQPHLRSCDYLGMRRRGRIVHRGIGIGCGLLVVVLVGRSVCMLC